MNFDKFVNNMVLEKFSSYICYYINFDHGKRLNIFYGRCCQLLILYSFFVITGTGAALCNSTGESGL